MAVDRAWLVRNLGFDATADTTVSADAALAASNPAADDQAFVRELIEFDSDGSEGKAYAEQATLSTGLSRFVDIDWPAGLEPMPGNKPTSAPLPKADVLIVTWTVDEGHALSRVLTPGHDSKNDWVDYTENYATLTANMPPLAPARQAKRLGTFWTTKIGTRKVTLFKSDSHMSQDGPTLPNALVWKQIIKDTRPELVITTGTGGGIGGTEEVGDVVVSRFATFDCQKTFKRLDGQSYSSPGPVPNAKFAEANQLFAANRRFLPPDTKATHPQIVSARGRASGILTTDFFGFDNTADTYGLEGKGALSEMGDAVLGMVCAELGADAPNYVVVRNVSDPQIDSDGLSLAEQKRAAANIYKAYGRWSTVCSAIVCWAIVAAL